jgi:hypothetical protein
MRRLRIYISRRNPQAAFGVGARAAAPRQASFTFFDQSIEFLRFYSARTSSTFGCVAHRLTATLRAKNGNATLSAQTNMRRFLIWHQDLPGPHSAWPHWQ